MAIMYTFLSNAKYTIKFDGAPKKWFPVLNQEIEIAQILNLRIIVINTLPDFMVT